ncbi:MAG: VCBS repeat-containing protein, partial [Acidobacteria bacterium]|nr:VCBS repeat-containing protein [Acidobacteriota bacterium]
CLWFENGGAWNFVPHRIARFGGTYAAATGDLDGDGDLDIALVSMSNDWNDARNASAAWLENDGNQNFRTWLLATSPVALITVACGDLNGDGRADVVAGGLELPANPLHRSIERLPIWLSRRP